MKDTRHGSCYLDDTLCLDSEIYLPQIGDELVHFHQP